MSADTVRIVRLSDRFVDGDPSGTWRQGQIDTVSVDDARVALATKQARLADGEALPDPSPKVEAAPGVIETAVLSGGEIPAAEAAKRVPRERGR